MRRLRKLRLKWKGLRPKRENRLNYSATHAKEHNLIYVLDALDAFNKRLVKKIEVSRSLFFRIKS